MIFHFFRSNTLLKAVAFATSGIVVGSGVIEFAGYEVALVDGQSMQPTLNPHPKILNSPDNGWNFSDWVLISHNERFNVKVGDIVTLNNPTTPLDRDIKRVKATEHQVMQTYKGETVVIPKGHMWVEGDNRWLSKDSNKYGPIPAGLVFGKAVAIVWPPSRWQSLKPALPHSGKLVNAAEEISKSDD